MGVKWLMGGLGEQVLTGIKDRWQLGLLRLLLHVAKGLVNLGYLLEDALGLVRLFRGRSGRIGLKVFGKFDQPLLLNSANERWGLFGGLYLLVELASSC